MAKTVEESAKLAVKRHSKTAATGDATHAVGYSFGELPSERYYKPKKTQITLRVDADVIEWFRKNHPRYQTLMNAVLRKEMTQALAEEAREKGEAPPTA